MKKEILNNSIDWKNKKVKFKSFIKRYKQRILPINRDENCKSMFHILIFDRGNNN